MTTTTKDATTKDATTKSKRTPKKRQGDTPVATAPLIVRMVLDASGSMEMVRDHTIESVNAYLKEVELGRKGTEILFALTTFNSDHTHTRDQKPVGEVKPLTREDYVPDGWTPLFDAIGRSIGEVRREIDNITKLSKVVPRVVMVIVTDGQENNSKEFDRAQIGSLISELEGSGTWTFAYLGANQDAWAATAGMNLKGMNVANYDVHDTMRAMRATAFGTVSLGLSAAGQSTAFYSHDAAGFVTEPDDTATGLSPDAAQRWKRSLDKALGKKGRKRGSPPAGDPTVRFT